ncbi:NAD(P)-dependent oxidoreductase [Streptosporangium soli]|nr:NAD-binding protein [Streptosporangium sp. KLBMP 9127]
MNGRIPLTEPTLSPAFFDNLLNRLPYVSGQAISIVVAHMLPGQPAFVEALGRVSAVAAVLPKPKSIDSQALVQVQSVSRCDQLHRQRFADPHFLLGYLEARAAGQPLTLIDVGGYFAPALAEVCDGFSGQILGVVEDTENGLRRYLKHEKLPCPVYSVARSPLKEPEDSLVGEAIVFSAEALIRSRSDVLHGRAACVLGFGKIGAGIARALQARHVEVTVVDTDPVRLAQALALGHRGSAYPKDWLPGADLVFCATGNRALRGMDFTHLRDGAYVASATSHDDELDLETADTLFDRIPVAPHVTRYSHAGRSFYLLNGGNAVNFLHGSAVGPSIHLVQAEILAALGQLTLVPHDPGLYEVAPATRALVAAIWIDSFYRRGAPHEHG